MSDQSKNSALLPSGFEDLLPPQAEADARAVAALMGVFSAYGYERVKPPMAEFEETLLAAGPGSVMSQETFRVMDPVTHRMMGLRSDVTAQIARIAGSRLSDAPRPLRLTYANDVIRTKASQARTQRQFTQVGCELIGAPDEAGDIEICVVALKGLAALGLKDVTIDFALPQNMDKIFELTKKDKSDIDALRHELSGPADKAIEALEGIGLDIAHLKGVVAGVRKAAEELGLESVQVTIDPLEMRGFEYHKGLAFTLFASTIRGELGRGGRYDLGTTNESAAGFTLYMDTIRQGLKLEQGKDVKTVLSDMSWAEIEQLQNDGFIVKRNLK